MFQWAFGGTLILIGVGYIAYGSMEIMRHAMVEQFQHAPAKNERREFEAEDLGHAELAVDKSQDQKAPLSPAEKKED